MTAARAGLALAGGLLLFAAHPPLSWGWAGLVALAPLVALARTFARRAQAVGRGLGWGLLAGVAFFGPLLTWIARFGILPWVLLVTIQALSVALYVAALAWWGERRGRAALAVLWWVALEAVRSAWPLGGFAWGVLGYSQHDGGALLPIARLLGVLGVSAAAAAVGVGLEALGRALLWGRRGSRRAILAPVIGLAGVAAVAGVAWTVPAPTPTGPTVDLAAVQGNDLELPAVVDRLNRARIEDVVARMLVTTARLEESPEGLPDAVVWPENSLDADFRSEPFLADAVSQALMSIDGRPLLTGALLDGPAPDTFLNVIAQIEPGPEITDVYVKRQLVPFGEYVPLREWLEWFPPLEQIPTDGIPGDEPALFDVAGALIGPVTCFESVFADLVHSQVRAGAQVLVVSTNNASFGRSPASRQHLAFSQVRAVETGRWVLHAGISGISGVVDPTGAVSQQTELFEQAIVRHDFPLIEDQTLATRLAAILPTAVMLAGLLTLVAGALTSRMAARRSPR